jgi:hypothetical protein
MRPLLGALLALAFAAPAGAQELDWRYRQDGGQAHLVYAVEGSDVGDVWLRCPLGARRVTVAFPIERRLGVELRGTSWRDAAGRPAPWPAQVTLSSGARRATLPGQAHHDDSRDVAFVTVSFNTGGPVLREFGRTGRLAAEAFGVQARVPPAPPQLVDRFLAACG